MDPCLPVPGDGIAAKSAELIAYQAGSCEPIGGKPVGEVVLSEPVTFCCLLSAS